MKSVETREPLVRIVREQRCSVASAARDLNISVRSATRFLTYFRDTGGDFHYDPVQWNHHSDNPHEDPRLRDAMLSAVMEQPELFLDELADAANVVAPQVGGAVEVSPMTVARVLAHSGYTRKVIKRAFVTRNEAHRACVGRSGRFHCAVVSSSTWRTESGARRSVSGLGLFGVSEWCSLSRRPRGCGRSFLWLWHWIVCLIGLSLVLHRARPLLTFCCL